MSDLNVDCVVAVIAERADQSTLVDLVGDDLHRRSIRVCVDDQRAFGAAARSNLAKIDR